MESLGLGYDVLSKENSEAGYGLDDAVRGVGAVL